MTHAGCLAEDEMERGKVADGSEAAASFGREWPQMDEVALEEGMA